MGEDDEESAESDEHVETPDEDVAAPAIPFCASKMDLIPGNRLQVCVFLAP